MITASTASRPAGTWITTATPARAAEGFRRALPATPHDWKLHYGLARSLRALHQTAAAEAEAVAVARLRERLDATTLGPRLAADLDRINQPATARAALLDLADLAASVGLAPLAQGWRLEAGRISDQHPLIDPDSTNLPRRPAHAPP